MKSVLVFVFLVEIFSITDVHSAVSELLKEDFFTIYRGGALVTREIQNKPVTEDKVTFYLFTSKNPNQYEKLDKSNLEQFRNTTSKVIFIIHGWTNNRESEWYEDMKNAFLFNDNSSMVIQVDWREPANQLYYVSSINTYDVSKHITKLIVDLYKNYGVPRENFLLVGHSLGGQITGFVGKLFQKETAEKLPRIIALDPAGPLFTTRPKDKRLNEEDAEVVEVIHSDGGTFGYKDSCGTIDFFVNGGSTQPGCKVIDLANLIGSFDEPIMCDHRRAYAYFTEALLNPKELVAQKCSNWAMWQIGNCDKETVAMGDLNTTLTGSFYLETNREKPYAKKQGKGFGLSSISKLLQH